MGRIIDALTNEHNAGSLRDCFLIAMPGLNNSVFSHTITYMCDHSEDGAMGIVINNPMDMDLGEIFRQFKTSDLAGIGDQPVMGGGPVQVERGFVLHSPDSVWESTLGVSEEVSLSTSRDIIEAMAQGKGPAKALVALGYAGWGPGQLEAEIADNAWLTVPADSRIIFDTPIEQRWSAAAKQLGIDLNLISSTAGHA
ncbi:YqgE/AlgH family protein [Maricurvus nonylphenolicus]|uniref:YqgE/AlgH family protein n=1 Tax=Maricurvus nonylphenolicus TaxID=1008307 RepID=UPI0036F44D8F